MARKMKMLKLISIVRCFRNDGFLLRFKASYYIIIIITSRIVVFPHSITSRFYSVTIILYIYAAASECAAYARSINGVFEMTKCRLALFGSYKRYIIL